MGRHKHGQDFDDCRTGREVTGYFERNENAMVMRNHGKTAAIVTPHGAVPVYESDVDMSKLERSRLKDALIAIGALLAILACLALLVAPALAQAAGG